jgi:regulator of telomere elongation helicase 1
VHVHEPDSWKTKSKKKPQKVNSFFGGGGGGGGGSLQGEPRVLSFWCFSPGITMLELQRLGVLSILLTSGTLSPIEALASELSLHFPIRLENPHVIMPNQVWVGVVAKGVTGKALNSSFKNRDTPEYKAELGHTVANFARAVPGGLLVFFPSYGALDSAQQTWAQNGTLERIAKHKRAVVVEPRTGGPRAFSAACAADDAAIAGDAVGAAAAAMGDGSGGGGGGRWGRKGDDQEPALCKVVTGSSGAAGSDGGTLLGVCRGKMSEGIDFADDAGRAVVLTGIPFAPPSDPKVLGRGRLESLRITRAIGIISIGIVSGISISNTIIIIIIIIIIISSNTLP